jgi:hypothetical protein
MRYAATWIAIACGSVGFGLSLPAPATAQAVTTTVEPGDNPLVITGRLDGQPAIHRS